MEKFRLGFTAFVTNALKLLLGLILITALGAVAVYTKTFDISTVITIAVYVITFLGGIYIVNNKNISLRTKIILILVWGAILRILWMLNANTVPQSDFHTMYVSGQELLKGDNSAFIGTGYLGRFPHLIPMAVYMASMIKLFPVSNIIAMKGVNLVLSLWCIYLMYKIVKEVFDSEKYGMIGAILAAVFPPFITYVGVLVTENIAIPFYMLSIYIFILCVKKKLNSWWYFAAGIALGIGNLFRTVAVVTLVALIMFIIIYVKEKWKIKAKGIVLLIIAFQLVTVGTGLVFIGTGVTNELLTNGTEPNITSILKGTNVQSGGRWNPEDAAIPEKYHFNKKEIIKACDKIIYDRLTETPKPVLAKFYLEKYVLQWSEGTASGMYWTELNMKPSQMHVYFNNGGLGIFQLVFTAIMLFVVIGLFNKKRSREGNGLINLFYIMFCGYGITYLITETQGRYAYIVAWIFIIMALAGLERIKNGKVN
ncbi:glycosyltransferase family 39 protein [uncultured Clostridium sp.]|uniref:glycosyltransferase family 39 protein n=1 Tax=uncultured Clostridium sp. TaxID=59620 RepID=UPI0026049438|nr:glycosyltransferase family 39 protein [uncultured Clostridium sp.]